MDMNTFYDLTSLKNLLADTLREKPCGYVIEEIFARFPSVPELLDATEQELSIIKGIGKVKARQIVSAMLLAKTLTIIPASSAALRMSGSFSLQRWPSCKRSTSFACSSTPRITSSRKRRFRLAA
jgi:hypothetical protein